MIRRTLHILLGLVFFTLVSGQEVPRIIHFTTEDYQAQSQNWDIAQAPDHQMYFGNSAGLLTCDGSRWRTLQTPFNQIVRTVYHDGEGRIFVGGFATLGYWHLNAQNKEEYVSLTGLIKDEQIATEEIWHILPTENGLIFQSFSTLYIYDFEKIEVIRPPGNIMFCRQVNGQIIVPVIGEGLYEYLPNGQFKWIEGSEIFEDRQVATILPGTDGWLVCLQNGGVFFNQNGKWSPWNTNLNEQLTTFQLNKGILLSNGHYAFGTILGGLLITDKGGKLLHHINQENGLQNNTVLSLFEDKMDMLWVGLDKGNDLIDLSSPLVFFQDKPGHIGTVYTAAVFRDHLYVGTNQGVFFKKFPSDRDKFQLIEGSQGQVWDLQVFDGQLVVGHNFGSSLIFNGQMNSIFNATGVYTTIAHPFRSDVLLQGTYTGIIVLKKNKEGVWEMAEGLQNFYHSAKKLAFDSEGRLWVLHPRKGLFRITLNENLSDAQQIDSFGKEQGLSSEFNLDMTRIGDEIILQSDTLFFTWDEPSKQFTRKHSIGLDSLGPGQYKLKAGLGNEWFKMFPSIVQYHHQGINQFRISMTAGNGQVVPLPDSSYLLGTSDGFAILQLDEKIEDPQTIPAPIITGVYAKGKPAYLNEPGNHRTPVSFKPSDNHLTFFFATPNYTFQAAMRFRLVGFEEKWSAFQAIDQKEFTNLPAGDYLFQVQNEGSSETASFSFIIEPKWYQTAWAKAGWFLLVLAALWVLLKWHDHRMESQKRKLDLEKKRELNQQRIQARNELLQAEILNKSRILADTTMNLVRKNEMLTRIKEELYQATRKRKSESPAKSLTKMEHLIDAHLTNEEDWQIFEANFNQLHDQFFKRLKNQYPNLTPGDLRLSAYLKMNLSSKEIAPLLNISVRGVENKRYRLRNKMGLGSKVNLTEYLMGY